MMYVYILNSRRTQSQITYYPHSGFQNNTGRSTESSCKIVAGFFPRWQILRQQPLQTWRAYNLRSWCSQAVAFFTLPNRWQQLVQRPFEQQGASICSHLETFLIFCRLCRFLISFDMGRCAFYFIFLSCIGLYKASGYSLKQTDSLSFRCSKDNSTLFP